MQDPRILEDDAPPMPGEILEDSLANDGYEKLKSDPETALDNGKPCLSGILYTDKP